MNNKCIVNKWVTNVKCFILLQKCGANVCFCGAKFVYLHHQIYCKMYRVTIFKRTTKKEGAIRLRFRLRDGRNVDLYHKSDIVAELKVLEKFTDEGAPKPKVSVYDKDLQKKIATEIDAMKDAYTEMRDKGIDLTGENFEKIIDRLLHPEKHERNESKTLQARFDRYVDDGVRDGLFGSVCQRQYEVISRELGRFLTINKMENVAPSDFTVDNLMDLRAFFFDEYLYVKKWKTLYDEMKKINVPTERRSSNTVAAKMSKMHSFFRELEDKEEIIKSPFRKLGKERKRSYLTEKYDEPVYLNKTEFLAIMEKEVPETLQEAKDAFLLQCAFGCRIGDFQGLTMEKVAVSDDGIPYIHYLPRKTMKEQKDHREIETPIMLYALDIIKQYRFNFAILKYVSGKSGYNTKIKELLKHCEINRLCKVFDEDLGDNTYKPLYEFGSSKLCRKTHVDMMNKVQVNQYAAGLHREGSDAVNRYTNLELRDRFVLMCAAFGQPQYKVDNNLEMIKEETDNEGTK